MDCDVEEEMEFNLLVNDVEMSDDELDKELKEIEKENKGNIPDEKPQKSNTEANIFDEIDENNRHSDNKRTKKKTVYRKFDDHGFNEIYDTDDRHAGGHRDHGKRDHYRTQNLDMYNHKMIDYRRLNKSLHVTKHSEPTVIGREIAYRLHEPKTTLFGHIVRVLGYHIVSEIFAETKDIVKRGGIKTDSGDRKRSPGGTFLYLMKSRGYATPVQIKEIFKEDHENKKQSRKKIKQRNAIEEKEKEMDGNSREESKQNIKKEFKPDIVKKEKDDNKKRGARKEIRHQDNRKESHHRHDEKEVHHQGCTKEIQKDVKKEVDLDTKNKMEENVKIKPEPTDPNDSDSSTGEIIE